MVQMKISVVLVEHSLLSLNTKSGYRVEDFRLLPANDSRLHLAAIKSAFWSVRPVFMCADHSDSTWITVTVCEDGAVTATFTPMAGLT